MSKKSSCCKGNRMSEPHSAYCRSEAAKEEKAAAKKAAVEKK